MNIIPLQHSFYLMGYSASSFPAGIMPAFQELESAVGANSGRNFYGISHGDGQGNILYWAAANLLEPGEIIGEKAELLEVKKGYYLSQTITGFSKNPMVVKSTFEELLQDSRLDPSGYCLEEYTGFDQVRCMVPILYKPETDEWTAELQELIEFTFTRLIHLLQQLDNEALNKKPQQGGWTAGQIVEHILICGSGIPDNKTASANRFPDQKVKQLVDMFLDRSVKYEAASFLLPQQLMHDRDEQLASLQAINEHHLEKTKQGNLEAICLDMEFPGFGLLTRYEWLQFIMAHTTRHTMQLTESV